MSDEPSIYKTPNADLSVREELPDNYLNGPLTPGRMETSAWLTVFYTLLLIPCFIISVLSELDSRNELFTITSQILDLVVTFLWVYLIYQFKYFINKRFHDSTIDPAIYILIAASIIMYVLGLAQNGLDENATLYMVSDYIILATVIITGVFTIILGRKLLVARLDFPHIRLFAWLNIISGLCMVTVLLILLLLPLSFILSITMAMIFFSAARELNTEELSSQQG